MPHFSNNIPFTISYRSIFSEIFWIASCSLRNNDFPPTASDLFSGMIAKDENKAAQAKKLKKVFQRCPDFFQIFGKAHEEINFSIVKNTL